MTSADPILFALIGLLILMIEIASVITWPFRKLAKVLRGI